MFSHGNDQFGWIKHSFNVGTVQWTGFRIFKEF